MSCLHTAIPTPSFCSFWHGHPYIPIHFLKMFFILVAYFEDALEYVNIEGKGRLHKPKWVGVDVFTHLDRIVCIVHTYIF